MCVFGYVFSNRINTVKVTKQGQYLFHRIVSGTKQINNYTLLQPVKFNLIM